jgi:hypothetical protein
VTARRRTTLDNPVRTPHLAPELNLGWSKRVVRREVDVAVEDAARIRRICGAKDGGLPREHVAAIPSWPRRARRRRVTGEVRQLLVDAFEGGLRRGTGNKRARKRVRRRAWAWRRRRGCVSVCGGGGGGLLGVWDAVDRSSAPLTLNVTWRCAPWVTQPHCDRGPLERGSLGEEQRTPGHSFR